MFSAHFIKLVLDNPVYCGKLAYGRRKSEKIAGTRNQYHIVKQDEYPVYEGVYEAIIPEEMWQMAQRKRQETGVKSGKIYNQKHENILSSILRCPVCGAAMYGNVNRKKKKDGTLYKDYYYYHCKHRTTVNGHRCGYKRQWKQEMVDAAVEEEIEEVGTRIYNVRQQKISGDNIYQFLLYFDKLYDKFTDAEKKAFLNSFIERVDIYEQEQTDGRFLKHIKFRFPVYFNGKEIEEMSWDNETTVETVCSLSRIK